MQRTGWEKVSEPLVEHYLQISFTYEGREGEEIQRGVSENL
jgi:hypothetical protein